MDNSITSNFTTLVAKSTALQIANNIISGDITSAQNRYEMHASFMSPDELKIFGKWITGFLIEKGYK